MASPGGYLVAGSYDAPDRDPPYAWLYTLAATPQGALGEEVRDVPGAGTHVGDPSGVYDAVGQRFALTWANADGVMLDFLRVDPETRQAARFDGPRFRIAPAGADVPSLVVRDREFAVVYRQDSALWFVRVARDGRRRGPFRISPEGATVERPVLVDGGLVYGVVWSQRVADGVSGVQLSVGTFGCPFLD